MRNYIFGGTIVFISGAAIMSLEMLGSRLLTPIIGTTIDVWAVLLSVFLLGIAGGYYLGDALADKKLSYKNLSFLFLGASFFVFLITPIKTLVVSILENSGLPYGALSLLYTAKLLFLPVALLSAITLYTIRLSMEVEEDVGRVNGVLYAISTVGGLVGIIGTSFFLVPNFGVHTILLFLAVILLCSGFAVLLGYLSGLLSSTPSGQSRQ